MKGLVRFEPVAAKNQINAKYLQDLLDFKMSPF